MKYDSQTAVPVTAVFVLELSGLINFPGRGRFLITICDISVAAYEVGSLTLARNASCRDKITCSSFGSLNKELLWITNEHNYDLKPC